MPLVQDPGSIARPVDQQSSTLPHHRCPLELAGISRLKTYSLQLTLFSHLPTNYLAESSQQEFCAGFGEICDEFRNERHDHLQRTQQTHGDLKTRRTDLQLSGIHEHLHGPGHYLLQLQCKIKVKVKVRDNSVFTWALGYRKCLVTLQ